MTISKITIVCLLTLVLATPGVCEKVVLTGSVYDVNTHREIGGVNIYIKNTEIGTISDFSGRYSLELPEASEGMLVVFQHIGYEMKEMPLAEVKSTARIFLQPRVIPLRELEVEAQGTRLGIEKDLPQRVAVFEAQEFEIRGYVDAADLLRSDHSIQVEEQLSGKKTVAIRAGNPDDVVVLYNGAKMNSTYNNIFDLSLINLEDVDRIEIVKGSNTALYGSEAFSGIINIVPRIRQDYNVRFQQRFGTYDSGNWGLNLYQGYKGLNATYGFIEGASRRRFMDDAILENKGTHHSANIFFDFSSRRSETMTNRLSASFVRSLQEYSDFRDDETLVNFNQIEMVRYNGNLGPLSQMNLSLSHHSLDESQSLLNSSGTIDRLFQDRSMQYSIEKGFEREQVEVVIKYELEAAQLNFTDERSLTTEQSIGLESAAFARKKEGFVSVLKFHNPTTTGRIQASDFDISFRRDRVTDRQEDVTLRSGTPDSLAGLFDETMWSETTFKLSNHFSGGFGGFVFTSYINYGTNVKFPTLFQQISSPESITSVVARPNLNPEKNTALELGVELTGNTPHLANIYGYQISASLFRNDFENKLRVFFPVGVPVAFYDNIISAKLSGVENQGRLFLLKKKITLEFGLSLYSVSERAAFPFKSDKKFTSTVMIDHAGYSMQLHWFKEGEQVGWIRQASGEFSEAILPQYSNVDFHFSKTVSWKRMKFFVNASGRNLLNRDVVLQGLALRDRRFYLTVGTKL
ncbi:MAG: TonB-dependent receptor [Candidatus Marinimicrobia bacterium]|nr:TonB-dependent receptor [Candidatus Neomarinimicrobiota bacterium]MDP6592991.1 TonB-dependent receptor [Candidatus Neomarinimicrobiota bacterium]MDP6835923.1 TonB-dependent receptor [Candidatus Neomarinimicrobiota bacterium]MDP6967432.1 TonB-dependent receptor [Candidatus Neomarinimicrobiota bacterium]